MTTTAAPTQLPPIGFIGLGALGFPMARNLLEAGYPLRVYNRTASKAAPLVERGAVQVASPAEAVTKGSVVISVLWDDASVEGVVHAPGFLERLGPGGLHISMTTILPETARRLAAAHAARGASYLDAPIFGRPDSAVDRKLILPLAGAADVKARARPILEALGGARFFDFGESIGAAALVKLVGNFLIISASRSMTEALDLTRRAGGDPLAVIEMLTQTLFASPIYQVYGKRLAEGHAPMKGGIPEKDIGLIRQVGASAGMTTPVADTMLELVKA